MEGGRLSPTFCHHTSRVEQTNSRLGDAPTAVRPEYKTRDRSESTMKALGWFGARDVGLIDALIPDVTERPLCVAQTPYFLT
ncbi:hypothetical protein B0H10DRAFT_827805 [Mycena sp. CBHHK59/15]|nr:hypothetical protein B0H10DRAFT_827805 [Mycena sp. CBHHK59/15]